MIFLLETVKFLIHLSFHMRIIRKKARIQLLMPTFKKNGHITIEIKQQTLLMNKLKHLNIMAWSTQI
jgi:hypothetical protein